MKKPGEFVSFEQVNNAVQIELQSANAIVYVINDHTIRVRLSFDTLQAERNYAFAQTVWDDLSDELFEQRQRQPQLAYTLEHDSQQLTISTRALKLVINKQQWQLSLFDHSGFCLHQDQAPRALIVDDNQRLKHFFIRNDTERLFGLGEKTGALNKNGRRLRMENTDAVGYCPDFGDPLYKHIPFLLRASQESKFCGLFYNNAWPSDFDLGATRSGYWGEFASASFDGGDFDISFVHGDSLAQVVARFTKLTGKPPMMPRYSLGYLGSTMFYTELAERSDLAINGFIEKCKQEMVPVSGFHLSSGYTTGDDGKRYVFNWNRARFPNPGQFVSDFAAKGLTLSPNIKPGVLTSHSLFSDFENKKAFICDKDNNVHLEQFWGGQAALVDFSSALGREAWKQQLKQALIGQGIYSIWNDNNEFEFNDTSAICKGDGLAESANGMRPILSNLMAKVAYDAIREEHPNIRPFVLSRAGFAGLQQWAHTWSGDNGSSWEYLRSNVTTMLGMSLSGVAFNGMDIGGFTGPAPDAELFLRWVQSGVFHPRFCIHSANSDNTVSEPWMHASVKAQVAQAMRFRYQLIPYIYQLAKIAHDDAQPIVRPLSYDFWHDAKCRDEDLDFMLGQACFVPAVLSPNLRQKQQYLPSGETFIDVSSGRRYVGGETHCLDTPLDKPTWLLRCGYWMVLSSNEQHQDFEFLTSLDNSIFSFYWDDGISFDYLKQIYCQIDFEMSLNDEGYQLSWGVSGDLKQWTKSPVVFKLFSHEGCPMSIRTGEQTLNQVLYHEQWQHCREGFWYCLDTQCIEIKLSQTRFNENASIELNFSNMIAVSI